MSLEVDINHRQGRFTLDAAFSADRGITALFGRSGSGKTTLVHAVAGLVRPNRGRVAVDGEVLLDTRSGIFMARHLRRVGYVFQDARLFPHLTVRQNLLFGRWFRRQDAHGDDGVDLDGVVDLLGIAALLDRRPFSLSGGEKQRVAIGRALLSRPRILLMDEPLASLDEPRKAEIMPLLERLRDEAGVPIVYVSHAVPEVARLATTIVVLEDGRVVAAGPATEVMGGRIGVRSLIGDREGGAVLDGRVAAHDEGFGLTRLSTPAGDLHVPWLDRAVGARVRAFVRARDVMLCLDRPANISALNVCSGAIAEIGQGDGAWVEIRLRCGEANLLARITRRSVETLGLDLGHPVYAVIKTMSFDDDQVGAGSNHLVAPARSTRDA